MNQTTPFIHIYTKTQQIQTFRGIAKSLFMAKTHNAGIFLPPITMYSTSHSQDAGIQVGAPEHWVQCVVLEESKKPMLELSNDIMKHENVNLILAMVKGTATTLIFVLLLLLLIPTRTHIDPIISSFYCLTQFWASCHWSC